MKAKKDSSKFNSVRPAGEIESNVPGFEPPPFRAKGESDTSPIQKKASKKKENEPKSDPGKEHTADAKQAFGPFFNKKNIESGTRIPTKNMLMEVLAIDSGDPLEAHLLRNPLYHTSIRCGDMMEMSWFMLMLDISVENDIPLKLAMQQTASPMKGINHYEMVKTRIEAYTALYSESYKNNKAEKDENILGTEKVLLEDDNEINNQAVISTALSQTGLVQGNRRDKNDDRIGFKRIQEYFAVASGESAWYDDKNTHAGGQVRKFVKGKVYSGVDAEGKATYKDSNDTLPEWCYVFCVWAFKAAGMSVDNWTAGSAIPKNSAFKHVVNRKVKPGDVGYMPKHNQHQFIVIDVNEDGGLVTVEGNTNATGSAIGGEVCRHNGKRKVSDKNTHFYRMT